MDANFKYDYPKLKKRASYPFETIAVSVSFSYKMEAILCETKRIVDNFKSNLILIHIGIKNAEKEDILDLNLKKSGINKEKCRIIWMEGDATDLILKICKLNIVDLLILGAVEKENIFKYYLGSIARTISRRAKCSVLLLTNPSIQPKSFKKIVVNGIDNPKTIHSLNTAIYFGKAENAKELTIIQEVNLPALTITMAESSTAPEASKIKKELLHEENIKITNIVETLDKSEIDITVKTINGKPGYTIGNYARSKNADLLVFNSPDTHLGIFDRIFTHDIEYVLVDIPCNLLIVHSRI